MIKSAPVADLDIMPDQIIATTLLRPAEHQPITFPRCEALVVGLRRYPKGILIPSNTYSRGCPIHQIVSLAGETIAALDTPGSTMSRKLADRIEPGTSISLIRSAGFYQRKAKTKS